MVEAPRTKADTSPASPEMGAPLADEAVRQQVARLFGDSLFGPWPELEQNLPKRQRRLRGKAWAVRLLVAMSLAGAVWGGRQFLRPGLQRQANDQRAHYAAELKSFLNDGDLESVSRFLPLVRGNPSQVKRGLAQQNEKSLVGLDDKLELSANDPHLELIVLSEAALYRYFDADPARLRRIRPHLEGTVPEAPWRLIVSLTLLSREERAARLPELERLRNDLPNRNDLEYLLASAFEFRNEVKAARESWERSARLGPAWLIHRFEQAWFELHQERQPAAQKIAKQIVQVAPDSTWAKLASTTFALSAEDATRPSSPGAAAADPSAMSVEQAARVPVKAQVQLFFEKLQSSIEAARRNEVDLAKEHLEAAAAAVRFQAPFLFDACDWLTQEKLPSLARHLTQLPTWPADSAVAAAKAARLSDSARPVAEPPHAAEPATRFMKPRSANNSTRRQIGAPKR